MRVLVSVIIESANKTSKMTGAINLALLLAGKLVALQAC